MTYRTADQDERLNELYRERDQICDYAAEYPRADCSLALAEVDAEIELLTTALDLAVLVEYVPPEPHTAGEAVAVVYGCANFGSREWFDGVKEIPF